MSKWRNFTLQMEIKLICPTLLNCELLKMRALVTEFYTTNGNKINFPHPTQLLIIEES